MVDKKKNTKTGNLKENEKEICKHTQSHAERDKFISSIKLAGFAVISTHAGTNPLLIAFRIDLILDQAEQ